MKITITVPQEIKLDASELPALASAVRKEWDMKADEPVYMFNLLCAARDLGLLENLPDDFSLDAEWEDALSDGDITDLIAEDE